MPSQSPQRVSDLSSPTNASWKVSRTLTLLQKSAPSLAHIDAAGPAPPQSLHFSFWAYSELPGFPLALCKFLYFSPQTGIYQETISGPHHLHSILSFCFYQIHDLRMSPVVFPPDTTVAPCQISPGRTDGGGAVCIFSSELIFSTGSDSLWNYLLFSCFFCLFFIIYKNKQHPLLCSKGGHLEQGGCLGWCRVN